MGEESCSYLFESSFQVPGYKEQNNHKTPEKPKCRWLNSVPVADLEVQPLEHQLVRISWMVTSRG